jgi:hypothetical protein
MLWLCMMWMGGMRMRFGHLCGVVWCVAGRAGLGLEEGRGGVAVSSSDPRQAQFWLASCCLLACLLASPGRAYLAPLVSTKAGSAKAYPEAEAEPSVNTAETTLPCGAGRLLLEDRRVNGLWISGSVDRWSNGCVLKSAMSLAFGVHRSCLCLRPSCPCAPVPHAHAPLPLSVAAPPSPAKVSEDHAQALSYRYISPYPSIYRFIHQIAAPSPSVSQSV